MVSKLLARPKTVAFLSLLFTLLFLVGLLMIFGPAVAAEARYQAKSAARALGSESGSWLEVVTPNIKLTLQPGGQTGEFGIVIPKIFVEEKVIANVDPTDKQAYQPALKEGIAHAAGTGLPGNGQLGYYFAHSSDVSLQSQRLNAVFYLLGKLENDDIIYLWKDEQRYEYRVYDTKITSPDDLSFLSPQSVREVIALQTCWPVGTSLKRLVVLAELVR